MNRSPQRSFDVACACGAVIHSSDEHLGRTITCRCGRAVHIQRPKEQEPVVAGRSGRSERKRTKKRARFNVGALLSLLPRMPRLPRLRFDLSEWYAKRAVTRYTFRGAVIYAAAMLSTWISLITASEYWLPATMLAYGPRWVVLLPLAALLPLSLLYARSATTLLGVSALIALGPVMGFRVALPTAGLSAPTAPAPNAIRVLSLNAQGGGIVKLRLTAILERYAPSIVAMQECGDALAAVVAQQRGWHTARYEGLCTMSRWPIEFADTMPRAAFARVSQLGYGGTGIVVRYGIAHPAGSFQFVNLHLETARKGLESLLGDDGLIPDNATGVPSPEHEQRADRVGEDRVALNARIREGEAERASVWSARKMDEVPVIIAGDFNMPVESAIYRRYWSGLTNAFDSKGLGFGFSKHEGSLLRLRIDHVLSAPKWFRVRGAWVGDDVGSDHRPMIADLTTVATP
ncbi:endonuclease/exonuclease/phosphatase family protein [Gemmatimonas sp.]|uniref:endonuclease/exonuclease/phosphatase family protein n=1 Tax=Gemmatimonas sp. TaxID=1962908 RepID=UPI00286B34DA|nr:endonuclease/exonuclease/phosphatase family protein [Gemmatimonas sp.]